MTVTPYFSGLGQRLPSQNESSTARQLKLLLASAGEGQRLQVMEKSGKAAEVILAPALSALLQELLGHIEHGHAVTLVPFSKMLTTQEAADILNVSRPYLIGLLEKGHLAYTKVGRHRRIKAEDLFSYKAQRDADRSEALRELAEIDSEII